METVSFRKPIKANLKNRSGVQLFAATTSCPPLCTVPLESQLLAIPMIVHLSDRAGVEHTHNHRFKHNQSMHRQLCRCASLFQVSPFILIEMTLHEGPVNLACCEVACPHVCVCIKAGMHMRWKGPKNISAHARERKQCFIGGIFTEDKKFNSKQILRPSAQYLFKLGLLSAIQCG